ncbi:MAG: toxin-antitoxin system YwqK family antitoxin [Brumimicrobium sp.]
MKLLVFCIGIFLLSTVYAQDVNQVDGQGRKQGEWIKYFERSNVPRYKGQFKDDIPVGEFVYYYPSNKVRMIVKHEENSPRSEAYFYHENKELLAYGIYKNQEKDSVWTHYGPSGRISFKETYKVGELHGERITYYVPEIKHDKTVEVMREAVYKNGRLNGPVIEYFPGGTKKLEGKYVEGKFEGVVKRYHPNGKLMIQERWKNRQKHGWWIAYDEKGKENGRIYYLKGEKLEGKELKDYMQKLKAEGKNPNE